MRITGIKINNYKSFGNENNLIRFDSEDTIALIGKNESGKSNTLLALKDLLIFDDSMKIDTFNNKNRINNEDVKISINIKFDEADIKDEYKEIEERESRIEFFVKNNSIYTRFDGFFEKVIEAEPNLNELSAEICKFSNANSISGDIYKDKIKNYKNTYIRNLNNVDNAFNLNDDKRTILKSFKEKVQEKYNYFRELVPKIIYFSNDMILKNRYSVDVIRKSEDTKGIELLLNAIDFSRDEMIELLSTTDPANRKKLENKLDKQLNKFNDKFNEYYKTNKIRLLKDINNGIINFVVDDGVLEDGESITDLSERSNGLKWYISMFIQLYSSQNIYKKCLILLDEPGNFLHVLAQKELLKLLMQKGNYQIIYTTHSPFMIDSEHLENIRLIEKEQFSEIRNGLNAGNEEVLTPILNAIGSSLNYNFGPRKDKINLIVEGITDYFYINAMLEYLDIKEEKRPYVLPCISASNESKIATILIGWGYNFKCLLDTDVAGKNGKDNLEKMLLDNPEKYIFAVSEEDNKTIESLLSDDVKAQLKEKQKTLMAKEFCDRVKTKSIDIDKITKNNFENLFNKIL